MPHVALEDHGTIVLVHPLTDEATDWLKSNVSAEAQYWGGALACEPRYVGALLEGMQSELGDLFVEGA